MSLRDFVPAGIAVMTISDTRTPADDKSGDTLAARIAQAGHSLAGRVIVKDDISAIRAATREFLGDFDPEPSTEQTAEDRFPTHQVRGLKAMRPEVGSRFDECQQL